MSDLEIVQAYVGGMTVRQIAALAAGRRRGRVSRATVWRRLKRAESLLGRSLVRQRPKTLRAVTSGVGEIRGLGK